MIGDFAYTHARWNVPVPVRPSRFVASHKHLQDFNVEVDLTQAPAFGSLQEAVPDSDLLYVDLQTNSYLDLRGRLGSGRAGFYRGRFLKGIGRTPLAANWNIISDQKRATGHLATSAAVREFVVSCYLRAKGKATTINGCEGLLVGPLSPALSNHTSYGYGASKDVLPCDAKMQAISVKGPRFARFSNFVWLLNNLDLNSSAQHLREFFKGFAAYLDSPTEESSPPTTPARIAEAFSSAIERSLENFREFWRLGISFGSPFNNISTMNISLRTVPLRCARPGTILQYASPHIVNFCEVSPDALAEAQFMHNLLSEIDAADDPERLLIQVSEAERNVAKYCGNSASIPDCPVAP